MEVDFGFDGGDYSSDEPYVAPKSEEDKKKKKKAEPSSSSDAPSFDWTVPITMFD